MIVRPELWPSLRLLHLHLNTLGFVGLTAIGTLQVLMPTILSGPDVEASVRLQQDLPLALVGVVLIAIGAALWWPLSLVGSLSLTYVVVRLGRAWLRRYGWRTIINSGAAASLACALIGFLLLIVFGAAHGFGFLSGHDAVPAFVAGFLMPLVTGALSQLLPVWCVPGRRTAMRDRLHEVLGWGGAMRALLFLGGGILLAFGQLAGLWLAGLGLLLFVALVLRATAALLFATGIENKIH
jgi:MFS family permease